MMNPMRRFLPTCSAVMSSRITISRVRKVVAEADIQTLNDLKVTRIDRCLYSLRKAGLGARTVNHYTQALIAFCNFLVSDDRLAKNPLKALTRYKAKTDVRHKRRALRFEEVRALIQSARQSSETIQSYKPEMRARL